MITLPTTYRLPAAELAAKSPIPLTILPDLPSLYSHFARAVASEIAANTRAGRPTRLILPVGPIGQYPLLVDLCNRDAIGWQEVHLFFMDEYCDWQGRRVSPEHPLSFAGFVQSTLLDRLRPELAPPATQVHFPDPLHIDRVSAEIDRLGGIDTCYGGIGIHGHIAFNEPPVSRWYKVSAAEFKASRTRLVTLAPETVVMNASRAASGNFATLPPMAVTLGMADILAARRIRLYCQGGVWQRTVLRIALFGSPDSSDGEDVAYPVTLLRGHPDLAVVTDANTAEPPIPQMAA
jgi:glucosamine-6-phosphate deaminase